MEPVVKDPGGGGEQTDTDQDQHADTGNAEGEDPITAPPQPHSSSAHTQEADMFDGYSYRPRHSVDIDEDEDYFFSEVPSPTYRSRRGVAPAKLRKQHKSSAALRSSRHTGKRREDSGVVTPDRHPEDDVSEPTSPWEADGMASARTSADVVREQNGSKEISLSARGIVDRYKLAISRSTTRLADYEDRAVWGMSKSSGRELETVSPSPSEKERRGRTSLFSWSKKNTSKTPQASSSAASKKHTVAHSGSTGRRVRYADENPGDTRGPRHSKVRSRTRRHRSGSVSEGHLSEGHQSLDDIGESKKKVDWYDV